MKSISFQEASKLLTRAEAFEGTPPVLPWFIERVVVDDGKLVVSVVADVVFGSDVDAISSRADHVNGAESTGHGSNNLAWVAILRSSALRGLATGVGWTQTNDRFLRPVRPDQPYVATLTVAPVDCAAKYRLYDSTGEVLCERTGSYKKVTW